MAVGALDRKLYPVSSSILSISILYFLQSGSIPCLLGIFTAIAYRGSSGNPKNEGIAGQAAWNGKIGQALHLRNGIVYHHVREFMW